jgi:copper(I)-binding protein
MNPARRLSRFGGLLVAALVMGSVAVGCSSSGGTAEVAITDAWARPSSAMASAGAAYMTIQNNGTATDALVGASSPAATTVEVHETVVMGSPAPGASGDGGMMGMQPVERLEIPAGGSVELKPGSYHIMLIGLKQDLKVGDSIEITLKFEKVGEIKVTAAVRES